jgi:hypothetical protein
MVTTLTPALAGSAQARASAYTGRRRKAALLVVALAFVMDLMDAVFFGQLAGTGNYGHAFHAAAVLQVVLLAGCAALSLALPRRIAADAYQPTI